MAGQTVSGTCTDMAGNVSGVATTIVSIDKTNPTITGAADRASNANGWYKGPVTIHFTCADQGAVQSGVATCPADVVLSADGANQSADGTAVDKADNSASVTVSGINIDQTAPVISLVSRTAANSNGWNKGDVTVTWSCTDSGSGVVSALVSQTVSTEGRDQSAMGTCEDQAGNKVTDTQSGINIDKTAPTASASASPVPNANGWNNTDVTVSFDATDSLSGIDVCTAAVKLTSEGAGQSASGTCTDKAGNVSASASKTINIDKTAPTLTGAATTNPNSFGWYKDDVTIQWTGHDELSGIDPATQPDASVITGEGDNLGAGSVSISDKAGNVGSGSVSGIKIDRTAPSVSLVGGPTTGGSYYFGSVPAEPTCLASDGLSELAAPCSVSGYSTTVGDHTVTASATDKAGNTEPPRLPTRCSPGRSRASTSPWT